MTTLVTGADGFLGGAVYDLLHRMLGEVVPVSRRRDNPFAVHCDLADPLSVAQMLEKERPRIIVNIAAKPNFNSGALADIYSVNTLAPAIFADYCKKNGAYLLQASGSIVHGFQQTHFGPETPYDPTLDYGISKLLADKAIIASGCKSAIVRFGGIYGSAGPSHLGINKAITQAKEGIKPKVVGLGISKRNYTYVKDAAAMILQCLDQELEGVFYAAGETVTMKEMLSEIAAAFLNGESPDFVDGNDSPDQIVLHSEQLGNTRSFKDAIADIKAT